MENTNKQSSSYFINEIFTSIQGEGYWTGLPATFIRFAGCNVNCDFCDTDYSHKETLTIPQIIKRVTSEEPNTVILTGGEPLLQPLQRLIEELKKNSFKIHLETNGTFPVLPEYFDWVTVSPKTKSPAVVVCDELRVLLKKGEIPHDYGMYAKHYFISPLNPPKGSLQKIDKENLNYCLNYVLHHPTWRLSVQLHKYLDIL
ncbi:MAG: 7-carboxy-7-deazaguanine synthase QueE [Candidatus Marinimicrobia bacterium]|nr:7-carboxy-7-deazaguanine synthase QueE [Candidatus Neomarinimicrobiota bacterium]MDD5582341.1 7-carboxy-7-deazaguanine synthase QueE [Candidatus Neomarinimicrobiota bacterium]